ncbi:MAG: DUF5317 domain-containing protein [Clostridiales bacterium]|nr:DUF5317 domain-containing protein [Clostridiales bacterium]
MIIAVFIVLSIPVGYLLGGKLRNIKNHTTRALGLPVAAFLLEAAAPFLRQIVSVPISQWHWMIVAAEYLLLFAFCLINRSSKAVWVIFLACVLNFFVIAWFGFRMPVAPFAAEMPEMAAAIAKIESGEYFRYTMASSTDSFWWLGDVILVPIKRIGGFASVGDVLLGLGCGALFVSWMRTEKKAEETQPEQTRQP